MNTEQIIKSLSLYPDFAGVFARDQLPHFTKRPAGLIVNTDPASKSGSHWLAYFIDAEGRSEFFDPLGDPVPDNEILKFIKRNSKGWMNTTYSNIPFQSVASDKCGEFCIFYLKNRFKGYSSCLVHALLSQNPNVNDSIV